MLIANQLATVRAALLFWEEEMATNPADFMRPFLDLPEMEPLPVGDEGAPRPVFAKLNDAVHLLRIAHLLVGERGGKVVLALAWLTALGSSVTKGAEIAHHHVHHADEALIRLGDAGHVDEAALVDARIRELRALHSIPPGEETRTPELLL